MASGGPAIVATAMSAARPVVGGLVKRVLTSLVLVPAFVWLVLRARGWLFTALVCAASAVALWELLRLFENAGQPTYRRLGLLLGVALTTSFELGGGGMPLVPVLPILVLCISVAAVFTAAVVGGQPSTEGVALTLLGVVYISWLLGHALLLRRLPAGDELVVVLVGVTWLGEAAAYAVGSALGRHPLAPSVSPRKTIEGAVAQFIASVVAAIGLAAWLLPEWTSARAIGAGALLGVAGQFGDLAESALKRNAGVKDAGTLFPGHGGMLDRIDSLLFNTPALYYYVALGAGR